MKELKYEPLRDVHAKGLLPIWSDQDVIRYTNIKAPCTLEEIKDKVGLLQQFDVFVVSHDDEVIGVIGCPCMDEEKICYGLFYHMKKSSWGQGFATRSTEWLLRYRKGKYPNITFFADVVADKIASETIVRRFGFQLIAEKDGFVCDGINMKIRSFHL